MDESTRPEPPDIRLKRLRMRSWRRGTKEMDLILGAFADRALAGLPEAMLDRYEALLAENDNDLYLWVTGAVRVPARFEGVLAEIIATDPTKARQP